MYRGGAISQFTKRVDLNNPYCNCFHLMPRVDKSTLYIFQKRALAAQYTVLSVPVSIRKNSKSHFLTFSTRLHNLFFAVLIIVPKEACSCDIIFTVEMLVILPLISHLLGNRRIHFLSRSRDQAENKASSKEESWRLTWFLS